MKLNRQTGLGRHQLNINFDKLNIKFAKNLISSVCLHKHKLNIKFATNLILSLCLYRHKFYIKFVSINFILNF